MIIEFSVQNFRSIYDKVTLSMLASKLTGKEATLDNIFYHENYPNIPLLKSAVIYGANASGKSNVLKALKFFGDFTTDSTDYKFEKKIPHDPFRLYRVAPSEPSCFEMDFIARDGIRYIYGFKLNKDEITEESLSIYTTRKPSILFIRKKGEPISFGSAFKGERKILEEQLLKNNLLLSKAANSNYEQMQKVYSYFALYFNVVLGNLGDTFTNRKSIEDPIFKDRITEFLRVADTGILSFNVSKEDGSNIRASFPKEVPASVQKQLLERFSYETEVLHYMTDQESESETISWSIEEESSGTRKFFGLSAPIIEVLNNGETLIIDEINNSLHPYLSRFLIELFHNKETNPKNAQLIFSTHDVVLLTSVLFRRDQIWFTEKNNKGMTELYSLSSFDKKDVRKGIPFDKWYLTGRFGAIPILQDFKMTHE